MPGCTRSVATAQRPVSRVVRLVGEPLRTIPASTVSTPLATQFGRNQQSACVTRGRRATVDAVPSSPSRVKVLRGGGHFSPARGSPRRVDDFSHGAWPSVSRSRDGKRSLVSGSTSPRIFDSEDDVAIPPSPTDRWVQESAPVSSARCRSPQLIVDSEDDTSGGTFTAHRWPQDTRLSKSCRMCFGSIRPAAEEGIMTGRVAGSVLQVASPQPSARCVPLRERRSAPLGRTSVSPRVRRSVPGSASCVQTAAQVQRTAKPVSRRVGRQSGSSPRTPSLLITRSPMPRRMSVSTPGEARPPSAPHDPSLAVVSGAHAGRCSLASCGRGKPCQEGEFAEYLRTVCDSAVPALGHRCADTQRVAQDTTTLTPTLAHFPSTVWEDEVTSSPGVQTPSGEISDMEPSELVRVEPSPTARFVCIPAAEAPVETCKSVFTAAHCRPVDRKTSNGEVLRDLAHSDEASDLTKTAFSSCVSPPLQSRVATDVVDDVQAVANLSQHVKPWSSFSSTATTAGTCYWQASGFGTETPLPGDGRSGSPDAQRSGSFETDPGEMGDPPDEIPRVKEGWPSDAPLPGGPADELFHVTEGTSESIPGDFDGGDSAKSTDASSTRATLIVETETCVAEDPSLDLASSVLPSEVTLEETSDTTPVPVTRPPTLALGDMVILGDGAPQEYRHHTAVVTGVAEAFCTVTVLDDTGGAGMGECWPNIEHLELLSDSWRIGRRVVVAGLTGRRTRSFNGLTGTIVEHPREGHPTFVSKPTAPERPRLTFCVRFEDASEAGTSTALLEPRFLMPMTEPTESLTEINSVEFRRASV